MNEIRKNTEEETVIIEGKFTFSLGAAMPWIITGLILLSVWIFFMRFGNDPKVNIPEGGRYLLKIIGSIALFIFVGYNVYQICRVVAIKKNKVVVTNKRIYGLRHMLVTKKNYSYRLDTIDDVEIHSFLGKHTLCVLFTKGSGDISSTHYSDNTSVSGGSGSLVISHLKNYQEVNEALNKLLTDKKNVIDVNVEIATSKIEAENKKAQALENMANNMSVNSMKSNADTNYIEELKKLKELCDQGIITKEEFEQEKKEILDNNHK